MKRIATFLTVAALWLFAGLYQQVTISTPALAQNVQCANQPTSSNNNACANTRFVQGALNAFCTAIPSVCVTIFGYANVYWYGATGDGSDEASDIQAAIAAMAAKTNGGPVIFNCATYRVGTTVTVPRGVSLVGQCNSAQTYAETGNVEPVKIQWIGFASTGPVVRATNRYHGDIVNIQIDGNFWAEVGLWGVGPQSSNFKNLTVSQIAAGSSLGINTAIHITTDGATYDAGAQYPSSNSNVFENVVVRNLASGVKALTLYGTPGGGICTGNVTLNTFIGGNLGASGSGGVAIDMNECVDTNMFYGVNAGAYGVGAIAVAFNRLAPQVGGFGNNFYGGSIFSDAGSTSVVANNNYDFSFINGAYVGLGTSYTDLGTGRIVFQNTTNEPRLSQSPSGDDNSTAATMYPLFSSEAHTTGPLGQPVGYTFPRTASSKFTFNPFTGALSTTSFFGKVQSSNDTTTNATMYPTFQATTGTAEFLKTSDSKLTYNPSTGVFGSTIFNAATGYQIAGAAASGNVLKGNGTNFVSAAAGNLSKTDDTNVTLTLGGTPTGALLNSASLTLGWTGTLALSRGGTGTATGAFLKIATQSFTANGTYTPTTGMLYAKIICVGAGAAGGGVSSAGAESRGGGGGGGGSASTYIATAADIGASKAVTVGAAGTGSSNATGGNGNDTSVGSLCIGKGGTGGQNNDGATGFGNGGAGGVAGTGTFTYGGQPGQSGLISGTTTLNVPGGDGGGAGLAQGFGARGTASSGTATAGNAATQCGGGGSGAGVINSATAAAGGAGFRGCVMIEEYLNQ